MKEPERRAILKTIRQYESGDIEVSPEIRDQSYQAIRENELLREIVRKIGVTDLQTRNYLYWTEIGVPPESLWPALGAPVPPVAMTTDNSPAATHTQNPIQTTQISSRASDFAQTPSQAIILTQIPSQAIVSTQIPKKATASTQIQNQAMVSTHIPTQIPSRAAVSPQTPTQAIVSTQISSQSIVSTQVPSQATASSQGPSDTSRPWSWISPTPPQPNNSPATKGPVIPTRKTHQPRNKVRFEPYPGTIVNQSSSPLSKRPVSDTPCPWVWNGGMPSQKPPRNEKSSEPVPTEGGSGMAPIEEVNERQPATSSEENENFLNYDLGGVFDHMTEEQLDEAMERLINYDS